MAVLYDTWGGGAQGAGKTKTVEGKLKNHGSYLVYIYTSYMEWIMHCCASVHGYKERKIMERADDGAGDDGG